MKSRSDVYRLRLAQLERAIGGLRVLSSVRRPRDGWLKAIRESLGLSRKVQASRVGISASTLQKSEEAEAEYRITLGQLRKLAEGLDCELVYALIPRKSLEEVVHDRAYQIALSETSRVTHTMALEDQRPNDKYIKERQTKRTNELLEGSWAKLWR